MVQGAQPPLRQEADIAVVLMMLVLQANKMRVAES